jgi:hypothetical protein
MKNDKPKPGTDEPAKGKGSGTSSRLESAVVGPYAAFRDAAKLADDLTKGKVDDLEARLSAIFSKLAELNDFPGVLRLYEFFRPHLASLDAEHVGSDTIELFFKVANAKLRGGALEEAEAILGGILRQRPQNVTSRRLAASFTRMKHPGLALQYLQDISDAKSFRENVPAILIYLELLADNRMIGFARAEILRLQTEKNAPDLMLMMANLEKLAVDKLVFINRYMSYQGLQPLVLRPGAALMSMDDFDISVRPYVKEGPLVSIIMTTYNSSKYVRTAIRSIQAQTYMNWELYVVDDRSSDGTQAILRELQEGDPRIRLILRDVNSGTYVSKNLALAECSGEFVTCHDSDDFSHPGKLEQQLRLLTEASSQIANISRWVRLDNAGHVQLKSWGLFSHVNPASLLFRRAPVVESVGFFDSVRVGADTEFRQRIMIRHGAKAIGTARPVLTFGRHHEASLTQSGAGIIDDYGVSPVRRIYTTSWLDWHVTNLSDPKSLYRPLEIEKRPFPVPTSIKPDPAQTGSLDRGVESWVRFAQLGAVEDAAEPLAALDIESEAKPCAEGKRSVVHAIDLSADSFFATMALNHVAIEARGGQAVSVWNLAAGGGKAWQGRRLEALRPGIVVRRSAAQAHLIFIYGIEALQAIVTSAADRAPARQIKVLVRNRVEAQDAVPIFARLGWPGDVLQVTDRLFSRRAMSDSATWTGALATTLFAAFNELPRVTRLGVSLYDRRVQADDLNFLTRLRDSTSLPVTALVDERDQAAFQGKPFQMIVADRRRNFWNDFFSEASVLIGRGMPLGHATLFQAPGQALQRRRLVAALTDEVEHFPGVYNFELEADLFAFLRNTAEDREKLEFAVQQGLESFNKHIGDVFHLARISEMRGGKAEAVPAVTNVA